MISEAGDSTGIPGVTEDASNLSGEINEGNMPDTTNLDENIGNTEMPSTEDIDSQISDIDKQIEGNNQKKLNLENRRKEIPNEIREAKDNSDDETYALLKSESAHNTDDIANIDKENGELQSKKEELQKQKEVLEKQKEESGNDNINEMKVAQLNVIADNVDLEGKGLNEGNNLGNDPVKLKEDAELELDGDDIAADIDDDMDFNLTEGVESLKDRLLKSINMARDTDFIDNVKDTGYGMYEGINKIRDTFYAPQAPSSKDWQTTVELRTERSKQNEERRKERVEKAENKFVKNEGNQQFMFDNLKINGMSVMEYYSKKYQNESDTYVKEKATDRVEKELEKMKGYAKYGYDAQQAYPLYQDQKKYGFTPEEAIRNQAGFDRFDVKVGNVSLINDTYGSQGIQVTSVSQLAPSAKEYYSNGYKDVRDIMNLNYLEQKLEISAKKAMQIDSVLKKHGKIESTPKKANETDKQYQDRTEMYRKINEMYKNNH